ncbi:MAG: hypothetical protein WCA23_15615 [Stellaceae bacterium]
MSKYALAVPVLLVACILVLADCTPQAKVTTSQAQIPAIAAGTARVWFLRGWDAPSGQTYVYAASPIVFANGASVGDLPVGSSFFRDFSPGTYTFTVQPYGLPTPQATTLQLAAGTQSYLQAQWIASWQVGYPEADFSFAPNTFAILTMSPQVAQAYLPTLSYLGQR